MNVEVKDIDKVTATTLLELLFEEEARVAVLSKEIVELTAVIAWPHLTKTGWPQNASQVLRKQARAANKPGPRMGHRW